MELIKNLKRILEDADEKIKEIEGLNASLEKANAELTTKYRKLRNSNEELKAALSRCKDMIERLREAGSPNELRHEASIYLNILEGLITEKVIKPYPDYAGGPAAARKKEKLMDDIRSALRKESK